MSEPFPAYADFEGKEGQCYRASGPELPDPVPLTLTMATTWGAPWGPGARQPFTLRFQGPSEPFLPQGTYHLQHPTIEVDLFTVPLGPVAGGFAYEVVLA